jgi:hypothetical protein
MIARAYVNWGRWLADCPRDGCLYAFALKPGQERYECRTKNGEGCGAEATIEWPADAEQIDAELKRRPLQQTRNWFPRDHELAVATNSPHGQSVADLRAEAELHGVK